MTSLVRPQQLSLWAKEIPTPDTARWLRREFASARHRRGLSQRAVEHALGVTDCHVAKYETGQRTPGSLFTLLCWAQALDHEMRLVPLELTAEFDQWLASREAVAA